MKHKIKQIDDRLILVEASKDIEIDKLQRNLLDLADAGVLTFGNINLEVLSPCLKDLGYSVERTDLCLEDDISLGLQMPDTWYLNRGTNALSISMYYNFLTFKEMAKRGELFIKNKLVNERFGRVGMIEVYMKDELETFLLSNNIDYFGTPKTLTECMRVLEGWDVKKLPRLKSYVAYSNFIQLWCSLNYPEYKASEWRLGRFLSEKIFQNMKTTNVREGVKYFWKNYLSKRISKISPGDVEIDVLSEEFYLNRNPSFVFIGEDIFSENKTEEFVDFKRFSSNKLISINRLLVKNEKDIKNAQIAKKMFPDSTIVVIRNPKDMPNFTMCKLDEIKQGISREVGVLAEVLVSLINKN